MPPFAPKQIWSAADDPAIEVLVSDVRGAGSDQELLMGLVGPNEDPPEWQPADELSGWGYVFVRNA